MHGSRIFGALVFASVAIVAAPASVIAQSTTDKMEQKAKGAAQDANTGISASWLTAKTKIALYGDDRIKGGQVSVAPGDRKMTDLSDKDITHRRATLSALRRADA